MGPLQHLHSLLYGQFGDSMYYIFGFMVIMSVVALWRLYEKAGQPGVAAIVPIWNLLVFLKIIGRPANHLWLFLIPIYGQFYLIPKVWIELSRSFGKHSLLDHILVVVLNGLYIFNLGMSYDTAYEGPVYGRTSPTKAASEQGQPSLA